MPNPLNLILEDRTAAKPCAFVPQRFIIAGWTSRDKAAMEHHITELEELGVTRPASTPVFYRNSVTRLSTANRLQTPGSGSSGEVEFVLFNIDGTLWVGVGSDHTDRDVEAYNITVSKQMCDKPICERLWRLDQMIDRWDRIEMESHAWIDGQKVLYQQGRVDVMLPPIELIARFEAECDTSFGPGDVMMGGTLPAKGGVRPAERFAVTLKDPETEATLHHSYDIDVLNNAG